MTISVSLCWKIFLDVVVENSIGDIDYDSDFRDWLLTHGAVLTDGWNSIEFEDNKSATMFLLKYSNNC